MADPGVSGDSAGEGGGLRPGAHRARARGWHAGAPAAEYSACQRGLKGEDVVIVREARPVVEGGPAWGLYCICDGHGGTVAANYVKSHMWRALGPLLPREPAPECEDCEGGSVGCPRCGSSARYAWDRLRYTVLRGCTEGRKK
eukprot:evm.model.scf_109.1 EVM.evm.TU.scf_109.1   scf_109:30719-31436(+)